MLQTDKKHRGSIAIHNKRLPHESAELHVSGEAVYTDDIAELAGTLHCALGLSQRAHAKLTGLDLTQVRTAPGVVDVLSAVDIPGTNDCGPIVADDPILADGLVQCIGQPVFAAIATSYEDARKAAVLGSIEYDDLPATMTPKEALEKKAFIVPPIHCLRGDPDEKLALAPHRHSGKLSIGGQEQFYLEGQVSYAIPKEQGVHVYCSTQPNGS